MPTIKRGENAIIQRTLYASDGSTPLVIADLTLLHAQVIQYGKILATYIYLPTPNPVQPEIREDSASVIEVEITAELSELFKEGSVNMKLIMEDTDAEYEADDELRDIAEFEIFTVEN